MTQFSLSQPNAITVAALTAHIRHLLEVDVILQDIWLEGEISNWSEARSGHIYFTLKDSQASIRPEAELLEWAGPGFI